MTDTFDGNVGSDLDGNLDGFPDYLEAAAVRSIQRGGTDTLSLKDATEWIYKKKFSMLVAVATNLGLDCDIAEDIAQDVMEDLVLKKRLKNFQSGSLDAWLRKCTYHRCIDFLRRRQKHVLIDIDEPGMEPYLGYEDQPDEGSWVESFWKDLSPGKVLSQVEFGVFYVYFEEDEDIQRTAERLQRTPGYVYRVLWKARQKLMKWWIEQYRGLI